MKHKRKNPGTAATAPGRSNKKNKPTKNILSHSLENVIVEFGPVTSSILRKLSRNTKTTTNNYVLRLVQMDINKSYYFDNE